MSYTIYLSRKNFFYNRITGCVDVRFRVFDNEEGAFVSSLNEQLISLLKDNSVYDGDYSLECVADAGGNSGGCFTCKLQIGTNLLTSPSFVASENGSVVQSAEITDAFLSGWAISIEEIGVSDEFGLSLEYESMNDDFSGAALPNASDDSIAYVFGNRLELGNALMTNYHYAVSLKEAQTVTSQFTSVLQTVSEGFGNLGCSVVPNGEFGSRFPKCGKYVVDFVIQPGGRYAILYEGIENGVDSVDYSFLNRNEGWLSGSAYDETHLAERNVSNPWWDVKKFDTDAAEFATCGRLCDFPKVYSEMPSLSGAYESIVQRNNLYVSRYKMYYAGAGYDGSDFASDFGNLSMSGAAGGILSKGRIIAVATVDSAWQAVFENLFTIGLTEIPEDASGDEQISGLKIAEFAVEDSRFLNPFENRNYIVFDKTENNNNAIAYCSGEHLLEDYFGGTIAGKHYINGEYLVTAVAMDDDGIAVSFPFEREMPISFFPGDLSFKFSKDDPEDPSNLPTYYARGKAMSALAQFQIMHQYGASSSQEEILGGTDPFPISRMVFCVDGDAVVVNKEATSKEGLVVLETDDEEVYRGIAADGEIVFGEANSSSPFGTVEYDDGWYKMAMPFGEKSSSVDRILIPSTAGMNAGGKTLEGTYYLMPYSEVKDGTGLPDSEDSYIGFERVFKCSLGSGNFFFIRKFENHDATYWVVSDSIADNTSGHIYARSVSPGIANPAEALSRYYAMNDGATIHSAEGIQYVESSEGNQEMKTITVSMADDFGNVLDKRAFVIQIRNSKPQDVYFSLEGSDGSSQYTGFYIKHGRFFPSDLVKAKISAKSADGLNLKWRLRGAIPQGVTEWREILSGQVIDLVLRLRPTAMNNPLLGVAGNREVRLEVMDEAGNSDMRSASIFYCSKLFLTANQHLVEESPTYSHQIYQKNSSASSSRINARQYSTTDFTRSWHEVWYPETHGMPVDETTGEIDATMAKRLSGTPDDTGKTGPTPQELAMYDPLELDSDGEIVTDREGRYVQKISAWDRTKTYPGMENRNITTVTDGSGNITQYDGFYRIIDNTGNSEFKLEFEIFDFSNKVNSVPANLQAPYDGDMLAFYDASDDSACREVTDKYGNNSWILTDASKLRFLFAVKGSAYDRDSQQMFRKLGDTVSGELEITDNGFITPSLAEYTRICIVPFTDYGDTGDSVGSGFKLKAGPKHYKVYSNYDCVEDTGEVWIHVFNSIGDWSCPSVAEATYKYYGSYASMAYDNGRIYFSNRQSSAVLGTFNCYLYLGKNVSNPPYAYFSPYRNDGYGTDGAMEENQPGEHAMRTFAMTYDDLVDYLDPAFFVVPAGIEPERQNRYDFENPSLSPAGKFSNNYTITKDVGIIRFLEKYPVPLGRIMGDYTHHTFYRLTSDGYGDLYFYDNMLVPASSNDSHTDWTYVNLKIVNEGTNTLNSGILQFLARGYITKGTAVDVVLDQNRPWDVQEGTTAETVQRTGAVCKGTYAELVAEEPSRERAYNARSKQTCVFGTLEPKQTKYLRVYWCIANNTQGTQWIDCTRGRKTYSAELSGMYFVGNT